MTKPASVCRCRVANAEGAGRQCGCRADRTSPGRVCPYSGRAMGRRHFVARRVPRHKTDSFSSARTSAASTFAVPIASAVKILVAGDDDHFFAGSQTYGVLARSYEETPMSPGRRRRASEQSTLSRYVARMNASARLRCPGSSGQVIGVIIRYTVVRSWGGGISYIRPNRRGTGKVGRRATRAVLPASACRRLTTYPHPRDTGTWGPPLQTPRDVQRGRGTSTPYAFRDQRRTRRFRPCAPRGKTRRSGIDDRTTTFAACASFARFRSLLYSVLIARLIKLRRQPRRNATADLPLAKSLAAKYKVSSRASSRTYCEFTQEVASAIAAWENRA